jgi:RNA polymerase sigma-70 factor (ECF subfamily)
MTDKDDDPAGRVKARDREALGRFIEQVRPRLMAYIQGQLGAALRRKVEPEDVFQEMSAEAVRALATAEFDQREPFSWLCQIAERRIVDAHRRYFDAQKRDAAREVPLGNPGGDTQRPGLVNLLVASMTTPSAAFSRNAREARLLAALQTLPEEQRDALRLRYVEGLSSKDIAHRLGKSDGAVRVMLTRAVAKLQTILDADSSD